MSSADRARLNDGKYLVGHWPLNGHAKDVSGHGNHGTWSAAAVYATGPFSGHSVAVFDGTKRIALPAATGATGIRSIACWFTNTSAVPYDAAMGFGTAANYKALFVGNWSGSFITSTYLGDVTAPGLVASEWYHIAGVLEGTGSTGLTLYVNGIYRQRYAITSNLETAVVGAIGDYGEVGNFLGGSVANARAYNVTLSANEVWSLFQSHS